MERFLIRLAQSPYREKFIFKGGSLLAKYIHIGRETQDLDFLIKKLSNTKKSLEKALGEICNITVQDSFKCEVTKIKVIEHNLSAYTGTEVSLQAFFGATKTNIRMDLGFGDIVDSVEQPIDLISTSRGPLFEVKSLCSVIQRKLSLPKS